MKKEKEAKVQKEEQELRNPIEALLDADDDSPIVLYDENDKAVTFEQVAIIPFNNKAYAILKPAEKMEGVEEDEAIVFALFEDENGEDILAVEQDNNVIDRIFEEYYRLLDEDEGK
ncbi:MAG: DUF1292 domain-containing protein [Spirochaetales bacterium]